MVFICHTDNCVLFIISIAEADGNQTEVLVPPYQLFATVADAEAEYTSNTSNVQLGIDFIDGTLNNLEYTIRISRFSIPNTDTSKSAGLNQGQGIFSIFVYN